MTDMPTTVWMRIRRRLCLDGNSLCRRSDRVAAWLPIAAIVAFLALSPLVVVATSAWIHADNTAAQHSPTHPVTAVTRQSASGPEFSDNGANTWLDWVPSRWIAGGREQVRNVPVAASTPAGSKVTVYLNRAGQVVLPPMTAGRARDRVLVADTAAVAELAVLIAMLAFVIRWIMDRRRLASWQTEWVTVGPRWSRHG
jgi:hypothetical protein